MEKETELVPLLLFFICNICQIFITWVFSIDIEFSGSNMNPLDLRSVFWGIIPPCSLKKSHIFVFNLPLHLKHEGIGVDSSY